MYATHPTTIRHLPDWFGAMLGILFVIVLALAILVVANVVDLSSLFQAKPLEIPTTTQMLQSHFAIEHHDEQYGTAVEQLQRVFFLEHQADMVR